AGADGPGDRPGAMARPEPRVSPHALPRVRPRPSVRADRLVARQRRTLPADLRLGERAPRPRAGRAPADRAGLPEAPGGGGQEGVAPAPAGNRRSAGRGSAPVRSRRAARGREARRGLGMVIACRLRVYLTQPVAAHALARLREAADVTMNDDPLHMVTRDELIAGVRDADVLFCLLHDRVDAAVLDAGKRLRLVA